MVSAPAYPHYSTVARLFDQTSGHTTSYTSVGFALMSFIVFFADAKRVDLLLGPLEVAEATDPVMCVSTQVSPGTATCVFGGVNPGDLVKQKEGKCLWRALLLAQIFPPWVSCLCINFMYNEYVQSVVLSILEVSG